MNIAFYPMGSEVWYGGLSYLKSLLYALHYTYGEKVKRHLINPSSEVDNPREFLRVIDNTITIPNLKRTVPLWIPNTAAKVLFPRGLRHEIPLRKAKINAIFGSCLRYKYSTIPTLSYFPDFQHIHLPKMFSSRELFNRNKAFSETAKLSSRIIIASECVKKDFLAFQSRYAHKLRIIRPVNYVPELIYETDPEFITRLYNLPEKFFYLPNQFWKHKNHKIVFDALRILKDRGIRVNLVCTGHSKDYRHPDYFTGLLEELSSWDFKGQVIYLGMIPYEHVFLLMRQSICVINPSLFEGFGMTISEARSVGKKVLLSDIPALREHNHPNTVFFSPSAIDDLIDKLDKIWKKTVPGPDIGLEEKTRKELPGQIENSAHAFMSVIREVADR